MKDVIDLWPIFGVLATCIIVLVLGALFGNEYLYMAGLSGVTAWITSFIINIALVVKEENRGGVGLRDGAC